MLDGNHFTDFERQSSLEGVWDHLKYVELRNLCCGDLPHLSTELTLAIRRLRTKPHLIRACFAGAGLSLQ